MGLMALGAFLIAVAVAGGIVVATRPDPLPAHVIWSAPAMFMAYGGGWLIQKGLHS